MLKAVLACHAVRYRWTHDLVELIDLLRKNRIGVPAELEEIRRLGPFATELRYGDLPAEPEPPLDRAWVMDCIRRTKTWAKSILDQGGRAG